MTRALSPALLIRGGQLVDGTGAPGVRADVAVERGLVAGVGPDLKPPDGASIVDATGLVVAPGFIDLHTHCDFTLQRYPRGDAMVRQGVTTVVTGNCGTTPFPVSPERLGLLQEATAFLGSDLDWNWRTADDFAQRLESLPLALNVVLLAGLGSVRIAAMGFEQRPPTEAELSRMKELVSEAMSAGCAGVSSGLIYAPGAYADADELAALAHLAAGQGGFYSTHMRDEGPALIEAVDEALSVARRSGASLQISHHKAVGRSNWGLTERSLQRISQAQHEGIDVLMDQYPYAATSTTLTASLPSGALRGGVEELQARLTDPLSRAEIRRELLEGPSDKSPRRDFEPESVRIASVSGGRRPELSGQSLVDIANSSGCEPVDAMLDLLKDEGGGVEVVIFALGEEDIRRVMRHRSVAVASDGWTLSPEAGGTPHPRSYGTFARVLGHYAREEGVLSLEEAVRKMTSLPARRLGMDDRGVVRPGARADLVLFDPQTVIDRSTYDRPHQFCAGVHAVYVDGVAVVRDGADTGAAAGRVLRKERDGYAAIRA